MCTDELHFCFTFLFSCSSLIPLPLSYGEGERRYGLASATQASSSSLQISSHNILGISLSVGTFDTSCHDHFLSLYRPCTPSSYSECRMMSDRKTTRVSALQERGQMWPCWKRICRISYIMHGVWFSRTLVSNGCFWVIYGCGAEACLI